MNFDSVLTYLGWTHWDFGEFVRQVLLYRVGLVLVAALGVQTVRLSDEQAAHATTRASFADERTEAARRTAKAESAQREIFEARIGEKDAIIEAARRTAADRAVALARSERAAGGLRDELAAFIARSGQAGGSPGTGSGSPPGAAPLDLLAGLFGEADRFAGDMAAAFEGSRDAGIACERSYNTLIRTAR